MALVGYNQTNDKLSVMQLRAIQLRVHGYNAEQISKLLRNSPKTSQELLRRAYARIRCRRLGDIKLWLEGTDKFLPLEEVIKIINSDHKITGGPSEAQITEQEKLQDQFDKNIAAQYSRVKWSY